MAEVIVAIDDFPSIRPRHEELYEQYFDCPIHFNAERTGIVISTPPLGKPLRNHDSEFYDICLQHCGQILRQINTDSPIAARLRSQLLRCRGKLPEMEQTAHLLGMSPRTLRRRLHEEGHNYRSLVTSFRADLAREYLQAQMPTKEIAYQLGFSDPNSFYRAFKLWTGTNVADYISERR